MQDQTQSDVEVNQNDREVRYNVKMPERLREDAKRNTQRGDLAKEVRAVFRRKAYGEGAVDEESKLDEAKSELTSVRERIDDLRRDRGKIDNEIETQERRATRLEERISNLEEQQDEVEQAIETLENMLQSGEMMWRKRIQNATEFDESTADKVLVELKNRNPEIPAYAFEKPKMHQPNDWTEIDR